MSGPQHKPESRCLPVSCGPAMPGPYASTMFYHAITAHVPGTVKTVPYKAPVDPELAKNAVRFESDCDGCGEGNDGACEK